MVRLCVLTFSIAAVLYSSILFAEATDFGVGTNHTCAIVDGGLQCWGGNFYGELGNNTKTASNWPVLLPEGANSGVTALSVGYYYTCGVINGAAKCWGRNSAGNLGNNTRTDSTTPVQVFGLSTGVSKIFAGKSHTCAIVENPGWSKNKVYCWGLNTFGQLGSGNTTTTSVPVEVVGTVGNAMSLALGTNHTCGVFRTSVEGAPVQEDLKCWGANDKGQLGLGTVSAEFVVAPGESVQQFNGTSPVGHIAAGDYHTCAENDGTLKCWGANDWGQLGSPAGASSGTPVYLAREWSHVTSLTASRAHSCAVTNGEVYCWGDNRGGQLGNGSTASTHVPVLAAGLGESVVQVSAGIEGATTCARSENAVHCWGWNGWGQFGNGTKDRSLTAVRASVRPVSLVKERVAPLFHRMEIDGSVVFWSANQTGLWKIGLGSKQTTFLGAAEHFLNSVKLNGELFYLSGRVGQDIANPTEVWKIAGEAAAPVRVVANTGFVQRLSGLTSCNGDLYYQRTMSWDNGNSEIVRLVQGGGEPIPVSPKERIQGLVCHGGKIYYENATSLQAVGGLPFNYTGTIAEMYFASFKDKLVFPGTSSVSGPSTLWLTNGQSISSLPLQPRGALSMAGDRLCLWASTLSSSMLQCTDGTLQGVRTVKSVPVPSGSVPGEYRDFMPFQDQMLFTLDKASTVEDGLWSTFGDGQDAIKLADVRGLRTEAAYLSGSKQGERLLRSSAVAQSNGRTWLYFAGSDPQTGTEIWRTDGTPQGTNLVLDFKRGPDNSIPMSSFLVAGGYLYFVAFNPSTSSLTSQHLYRLKIGE